MQETLFSGLLFWRYVNNLTLYGSVVLSAVSPIRLPYSLQLPADLKMSECVENLDIKTRGKSHVLGCAIDVFIDQNVV